MKIAITKFKKMTTMRRQMHELNLKKIFGNIDFKDEKRLPLHESDFETIHDDLRKIRLKLFSIILANELTYNQIPEFIDMENEIQAELILMYNKYHNLSPGQGIVPYEFKDCDTRLIRGSIAKIMGNKIETMTR